MTPSSPILLFDGVCNLCNGVVQFVIKKDKKGLIKFASMQGEPGNQLLAKYQLPADAFNSFVFICDNRMYQKSTAALKLCTHLKGGWPICYVFMIVPVFIRDAVYNLIARNRYKWFGKTAACYLPTPELQSKFLS